MSGNNNPATAPAANPAAAPALDPAAIAAIVNTVMDAREAARPGLVDQYRGFLAVGTSTVNETAQAVTAVGNAVAGTSKALREIRMMGNPAYQAAYSSLEAQRSLAEAQAEAQARLASAHAAASFHAGSASLTAVHAGGSLFGHVAPVAPRAEPLVSRETVKTVGAAAFGCGLVLVGAYAVRSLTGGASGASEDATIIDATASFG